MTLQLIDKSKIYFYLSLLLILLSVHNANSIHFFDNFFKIKKINLIGEIDENLNKNLLFSLEKFYNNSIFNINIEDIRVILDNHNIINDYKIKKNYPSEVKIEIRETKILAYSFENNKKYFIGANGKKIKIEKFKNDKLPLIVGQFEVNKFLELNNVLLANGFQLKDFEKFYFFKSNRWDLIYKNGTTIKLSNEDMNTSINLFKQIIENPNNDKFSIIDLRLKNKIILL